MSGTRSGMSGYGREDCHRDLEFGASTPERRHERAANPVAVGGGCGAETHSVEAVLVGELRELVGSGGIFGVDATDAVKLAGIALQD